MNTGELGTLSLEVRRVKREADNSPASSGEIEKVPSSSDCCCSQPADQTRHVRSFQQYM